MTNFTVLFKPRIGQTGVACDGLFLIFSSAFA